VVYEVGTGYWVLGTGYWVLGTGYWVDNCLIALTFLYMKTKVLISSLILLLVMVINRVLL